MDQPRKRPQDHHDASQQRAYGNGHGNGIRPAITHSAVPVAVVSTSNGGPYLSASPGKRLKTAQFRTNLVPPNPAGVRVFNHNNQYNHNSNSNFAPSVGGTSTSTITTTPTLTTPTTTTGAGQVTGDDPKLSKQFLKARPINNDPVTAADFVKFFEDPPHAAKLQHPGQQRDRAIAAICKQESQTQPSSSSSTTPTLSSLIPPTVAGLSKYRKLTFTSKRINQHRIFLAALFLQNRLRTMARLSDPDFVFKISVRPGNQLFESLTEELELKYTKHHQQLPTSTASSSSAAMATTTSLFKGVTGQSLLGLYSMLLFKARELETFQSSLAAQTDPWTPTRLSNIAMDLLLLDRELRQREKMQRLTGKDGGSSSGGVIRPPATLGRIHARISTGEMNAQDWRGLLEDGLFDDEMSLQDQIAKSGMSRSVPVGRFVGQGVGHGWVEGSSSSNGSNNHRNSNNKGPGMMGQEGDEQEAEGATTSGSGFRKNLWEMMTVQARAFQELTDEVKGLREEASTLREEASRLRGEVAQLRHKDAQRDLEMTNRFREVEGQLASVREECGLVRIDIQLCKVRDSQDNHVQLGETHNCQSSSVVSISVVPATPRRVISSSVKPTALRTIRSSSARSTKKRRTRSRSSSPESMMDPSSSLGSDYVDDAIAKPSSSSRG
ncbi:hypothetical protein BGW39_005018 [Mortierella sp. 14UC]|nr:hypothetical protein BGW39_005018 [Mortierella sp. 14UC]